MTAEEAKAVERLTAHVHAFTQTEPRSRHIDDVAAILAALASKEAELAEARRQIVERDEALKAEQRQKHAYLDEIDRQKVRLAERRGVLEWIANHRNDGLTDGSPATRTCLDEIVNLAAAALLASTRSPGETDQGSSQSQPVLSPKSDNADGWIKWSGGVCPVDGDVLIEIRCRDGSTDVNAASWWTWDSEFAPIVAYRVVADGGEAVHEQVVQQPWDEPKNDPSTKTATAQVGEGPVVAAETAEILHQVWDLADNSTLCTARDESTAERIAAALRAPGDAKPAGEVREADIRRAVYNATRSTIDGGPSGPVIAGHEKLEGLVQTLLSLFPDAGEAVQPPSFQERTSAWVVAAFGDEVACDELERMDRHVEEVFEGLQARNYPRERLAALENYVWSRPVGEIRQEIGGIMTTLAAWCAAMKIDMHEAGEVELARIWTKVEQIRVKQAAKPKGSALPIATPVEESAMRQEGEALPEDVVRLFDSPEEAAAELAKGEAAARLRADEQGGEP